MNKQKTVFLLIFFAGLPFLNYAQASKDSAIILFKNVIENYQNTHYLSFNIEYTYTEDEKPNIAAETIQGQMKMNKENYHLILGNTETIHTDKYNITLFKDDSLIYISKASVGKITANPVSMLDSMLIKIKNIEISLTHKRKVQTIVLDFPKGMNYKTATFMIDEKTKYLLQVSYRLNALEMVDAAARNSEARDSLANEWGMVQSYYSGYETGKFDDNEFDEKKYFTKNGKEFKPTEAYKQYKIFLASPGL